MRGFSAVGLYYPQHPENIGSVLRASDCFESAFVAIGGTKYKRCSTDTYNTYKHKPLLQVENLKDVIPFNCIPVAVDLLDDAVNIHEYEHPERAFYIFGPEYSTLDKNVLEYCKDKIYIPTKGCLNLAMAVNIVLYDRNMKLKRKMSENYEKRI